MARILNEQAGKLLLALALVWLCVSPVLFPTRSISLEKEDEVKDYARKVQVAFNPQALAPREAVYPDRNEYRGTAGLVWSAPEQKITPFTGLELPPVTRASVMPPPQLLPVPGPSLQGADKFPRWGQELPPITPPTPDGKKIGGPAAGGGGAGGAGAGGGGAGAGGVGAGGGGAGAGAGGAGAGGPVTDPTKKAEPPATKKSDSDTTKRGPPSKR
jgi:hypothetical protein